MPTPNQLNDVLCSIPDELHFGFLIFQLSPLLVFPVYAVAVHLLIHRSTIHAKQIREIYLRNLAFNVLCMITITLVLCPIFYLPMIGYQSNGLIRYVNCNLAIPAVFTMYCLLGVAVSIMHFFHYRLDTVASMNLAQQKQNILKNLQILVYLTYIFLVFTCISFLGLLTVENLQPSLKPVIYEKYKIPEVWCTRYIVADPLSWQVIISIGTTIFFILGVTSVVLLCGFFTLVFLFTARTNLSQHTLRTQKKFTAILIVQAAVHIIFILGPIVCIVIAVYFGISVNDGGLFFFFVEAHQGSASTVVFILTHSAFRKSLKYVEFRVRSLLGMKASENIWAVSRMELRSKTVV